jgi:hypothetical protein
MRGFLEVKADTVLNLTGRSIDSSFNEHSQLAWQAFHVIRLNLKHSGWPINNLVRSQPSRFFGFGIIGSDFKKFKPPSLSLRQI